MVGIVGWAGTSAAVYAASDAPAGLGKTGLIAVIVLSIIAITAFVWIFRETGPRD
jgi:DMSO/TMAO reductase YedYZ heme-binding membrane subunit